MDWSAIYDETGDEDGDWTGFSSRLTPILENFSSRGQYSPLICYIFTINYILGVGCLGIPYAFLKSGIILGSLLIIVLSAVAYITVMWVAESGHRDLEIRQLEDDSLTPTKGGKSKLKEIIDDYESPNPKQKSSRSGYGTLKVHSPCNEDTQQNDERVEFSSLSALIRKESYRRHTYSPTPSSLYAHSPSSSKHRGYRFRLPSEECAYMDILEGDGEAEVVELVQRFLGPTAKSAYQIAVMLLMSIGLIAYTQVFVQTIQEQLLPRVPNYLSTILFAIIVVPLSCVDLAEQVHIQVVMSVLRFVSLGALVIGTMVAMFVDFDDSGYVADSESDSHMPLYDMTGFSLMFTTAIFSQLFQHSVPGLIRPLPSHDKQDIPKIFLYALCTTGGFYLVVGISCVYYFGPRTNPAINLNFVNFSWGLQDASLIVWIFARSMSMIVVLFPALDTMSVFPLIANTLGNNLNVSFPRTHKKLRCFIDEYTPLDLETCEIRKVTTRCWRLVAALPPIIFSVVITDLSLTLQFAGLCGVLVALITPSLLQYFSSLELQDTRRACLSEEKDEAGDKNNPYSGIFSKVEYTYLVLSLAVAALMACTYQIYNTVQS